MQLLHVSSPLCVNFANPEAIEEGATSLEAGEGDGVGDDSADVAFEFRSALAPLLSPPTAAAAAEEVGLRMLASGAITRARVDKERRERKREREASALSRFAQLVLEVFGRSESCRNQRVLFFFPSLPPRLTK